MKKTFSFIYFCAAMLLIIAMTVGAFMPMMKINNLVSPYHESYSKGHFTGNTLAPAATNYGLGTVLGSIADFGDIKTVIDVQNAEQSVRDQEKVIEKIEEKLALAGEEGYSKEHYEHDLEEANKKLEKLEEKLSKKLEKITEDDENRIAAKLEKESFRQGLGLYYSLYSIVLNNINEDSFSTKAGTPGITLTVLKFIFLIFFLVLIVVMVIVPIIMTVKLIVSLVHFIKNIGNEDGWDGSKLTEKLPTAFYFAILLMSFLFLSLVFFGIFSFGTGAYVFIIATAILYVLRTANAIICAKSPVYTVIKQAIALVSLVLAVIFLMNFHAIGFTGELVDNMEDFRDTYRENRIEELISEGKEPARAESIAKEEADSQLMPTVGIFFGFSFVAFIIALVAAINSFERFGLSKQKLKDGSTASYGAMIVSAALLIAIAFVPNLFAVDGLEERSQAYEEGKFKVVYDEYLIDGSPAQLEYELANTTLELSKSALEAAKEEYNNASDDVKETLKAELERSEDYVGQLEISVKNLETDQKGNVKTCIITSILFLVFEIAYKVSPKTEYDEKKKKAADAEE